MVIAGGGSPRWRPRWRSRELAPEHTDVTVLAPNAEFVYRPMTVREPFAFGAAHRYPLAPIVADAGAELLTDELGWIDPAQQTSTPRPGRRSSTTRWCWRSVLALSRATRMRSRSMTATWTRPCTA